MTAVAKALTPHLECPICLRVPRHGVMLMCVNGHNVCAVCKAKIGKDAKCPQGRCDFGVPPTRSRTVASLVESFPFEWPCKFQLESGCSYEGTAASLAPHEANCEPWPCVEQGCKEKVSLGTVFEHVGTSHKAVGKIKIPTSDQVAHWVSWDGGSILGSEDFKWLVVNELVSCSYRDDKGSLFVWTMRHQEMEEVVERRAGLLLARTHPSIDTSLAIQVAMIPIYPVLTDMFKVLQEKNKQNGTRFSVKAPIEVDGVEKQHWKEAVFEAGFYVNERKSLIQCISLCI